LSKIACFVSFHNTFLRWIREDNVTTKPAKTGRPRTPDDLRQLVLRMARETGWSAERIHGELDKPGLASICESTVRNILKAEGIEPAPQRGNGTWAQFDNHHLKMRSAKIPRAGMSSPNFQSPFPGRHRFYTPQAASSWRP
jgi:hypothetical protein